MKKSFRITAFLIIGVFTLIAQSPEKLTDQAQVLFEQGELELSEQKLLEVIDINAAFAPAYYLLSKIAFKKGDLSKTGAYLLQAIEYDRGNEEYRTKYEEIGELKTRISEGVRDLRNRDFEEALVKFESIQEKYPDFPGALYYQGIAHRSLGEYEESASMFKRALKLYPDYEKAKKALEVLVKKVYLEANEIAKRGEYDLAIEKFSEVLKFDPNYYLSYYQIAFLYTKLGNNEKAKENYKKVVEINPSYSKGWFGVGMCYYRDNEFEKAISSFESAIKSDSTYAKAYAQIGTIYTQQKDYKAAEEVYKRAIQVDPSYSKPYVDLGKIYTTQERFDEAINTLTTAVNLDEKSHVARFLLAQSYNALNQCSEAKEAAYSALAIKSNYGGAHFELGMAEVCLGNKTAALAAFERARKDRTWRKLAEHEIDKIKHPEKYKE